MGALRLSLNRGVVCPLVLLILIAAGCGGGGDSTDCIAQPVAEPAGSGNVTSANAPGVVVLKDAVTVYVPFASDVETAPNVSRAVIENSSGTLPPPVVVSTDRVNSCAGDLSDGAAFCSGAFGKIDLISPGATSAFIFNSGATNVVHYTDGNCVDCGAAVDSSLNLGILSTGNGFMTVDLCSNAVSPPISNNGEPPGANFGYDPIGHRILSPNYQLTDLSTGGTSPPHFQIMTLTPQRAAFDLANDSIFFNAGTCTSTGGKQIPRDILPESGAIDTTLGIAYATFQSPGDCQGANTATEIGLFDLTQATFTPGSPTGTWDTPGKQIQTLAELPTEFGNGITGISVISGEHLAVIASRTQADFTTPGFGALSLPTTSGSGTPAILDWVQASMPNDPGGHAWAMAFLPNGLTSYVSPNTGKALGVIMNQARTFVAIVDLKALLAAPRASGTAHTVDPSFDLVGSGVVRFAPTR